MEQSIKKKTGKFFLQLGIILFITFLVPNFIGLSKGGFSSSEILGAQTFYLIGGIFALLFTALFIYQISSNKGDKKYGDSVGFASLGDKPHLGFFKRFTGLQIFLLALIFFLTIFFINSQVLIAKGIGQKTYTGVGFLPQQFTPMDSIIYSTFLGPGAENLGAAALIAIIIVLLGIWARKKEKISPQNFQTLVIIAIIVGVLLFGLGNHLLHYKGSEVALQSVAIFWAIGGLLTAITGSFLVFWAMHISNNFIFDMTRLFSADTSKMYILGLIIALIVFYVVIFQKRLLGRKKYEE